MDNANNIFERKNFDGSIDYIINIGNVLYNNKIVSIVNIVLPLRQQSFFIIPMEKRYYAAVNIYYSIDTGKFIFDTVKKSVSYIDSCDSDALTSALPIGQFILQQSLSSFEVKKINLYSKMSTFAITSEFIQGDRGAQGKVGDTGIYGYTGYQGYTGIEGPIGYTGIQGDTCVGMMGSTGIQGETGVYQNLDLLLYLKFKTNDINLTDYSSYERDLVWGATGAGLTGIIFNNETGSSTSIEIIDQGQSVLTLEEGIIDNCHSIQYRGGISGYRNNKYIGFTGTIQAWINVNQPPIADFIYETYTGIVGYPIRFIDASLYIPKTLTWDIDGYIYNSGIITHSFGSTGIYVVKLTATNSAGSHIKSEQITIA
jgi:hypothetical protein